MIAQYMINHICGILGLTFGVDAYAEFQPDKPDNCVTCYDVPTYQATESSCLQVDNMGCQIQYRNKSFLLASAQAETVHKAIMAFDGVMYSIDGLTSIRISTIQVDQMPVNFGTDKDQRHEIAARYRVRVMSSGDSFRL